MGDEEDGESAHNQTGFFDADLQTNKPVDLSTCFEFGTVAVGLRNTSRTLIARNLSTCFEFGTVAVGSRNKLPDTRR